MRKAPPGLALQQTTHIRTFLLRKRLYFELPRIIAYIDNKYYDINSVPLNKKFKALLSRNF